MLSMLFAIIMIIVFGKLLIVAMKAAWGITRVLFTIVLLPLVLIGLVLGGLLYIALPVLLVIGVVSLFCKE